MFFEEQSVQVIRHVKNVIYKIKVQHTLPFKRASWAPIYEAQLVTLILWFFVNNALNNVQMGAVEMKYGKMVKILNIKLLSYESYFRP